jgi:hypothetical protein
MGSGMGAAPAADQSVPPIDRDVVFVAKGRDREIHLRRPVLARLGLAELHRPARVTILLAQFGGLLRPALGDLAGLDRRALGLGVALLGGRHDRRIDDLPAHRQIAAGPQRGIKAREQRVHRARPLERLAEGPDRVGVRHRVGQPQTQEAHEGEAVLDQILAALVR